MIVMMITDKDDRERMLLRKVAKDKAAMYTDDKWYYIECHNASDFEQCVDSKTRFDLACVDVTMPDAMDYLPRLREIFSEDLPAEAFSELDASWSATFHFMRKMVRECPEGMLPNTYLQYYLYRDHMLAEEDPNHTRADEVMEGLSGADLVVLEANYDPDRLKFGPYPYYLKSRIASPRGHLCNRDAGDTLAELLRSGCERFALCHLSQENNTPQLALQAATESFLAAGALPGQDGLLQVLHRSEVSPAIQF